MPENARLSEFIDQITLDFVEWEATPRFFMKLGIQLHLAGISLSNTVSVLDIFGVERATDALRWGEIYEIDEQLSIAAGRIASEIGPQGPYLDGVDALVAAIGQELYAPVVSADSYFTHPETRQVVDVDEYRD